MSGKAFTLSLISLLAIGVTGVWLAAGGSQQSPLRLVAGLCLTLGAVAGLLIVFRRDLTRGEAEKRAEWAKAKAAGRRRFVLRQALNSLGSLLLPALGVLGGQYFMGRPAGAIWYTLRAFVFLAAIIIPVTVLLALAWWHSQEKRYAGVRLTRGAT
jgi:hypothetical protein